eukprot:3909201-Prymnesium_polylepis.1
MKSAAAVLLLGALNAQAFMLTPLAPAMYRSASVSAVSMSDSGQVRPRPLTGRLMQSTHKRANNHVGMSPITVSYTLIVRVVCRQERERAPSMADWRPSDSKRDDLSQMAEPCPRAWTFPRPVPAPTLTGDERISRLRPQPRDGNARGTGAADLPRLSPFTPDDRWIGALLSAPGHGASENARSCAAYWAPVQGALRGPREPHTLQPRTGRVELHECMGSE